MYSEVQKEIFVCDCSDTRHQFIVWTDGEYFCENDVVTCFEVRLNHHASLMKRIIEAFKYIFKVDDAEYEEVLLTADEVKRLCQSLKGEETK